MTKLCNLTIDVGVSATGTGVGCVALLGTSGIGHYGVIVMAEIGGQDCAADGTGLVVQAISGGACGVAEGGSFAIDVGVSATGTGVSGVALLGASGICDYGVIVMAEFFGYDNATEFAYLIV